MTTHSGGAHAAHPTVRSYAATLGLGPAEFRGDGRLVLSVDEQYRVTLRPGPDGRIVMSCGLMDLGAYPVAAADALLVRLGTWAAGLLREHGSGLAIDPGGTRLVLQQILPASCDLASLQAEVEDFINVLSFWSRTCEREAGRA
jgi:hypothetical protein